MTLLKTATGQPRVVVTGMGAVTPLGLDVQTTWDAMVAGKSGVARITQFDPSRLTTTIAAEVTAGPWRSARRRRRPARSSFSAFGRRRGPSGR